jgi:hypothetical protein
VDVYVTLENSLELANVVTPLNGLIVEEASSGTIAVAKTHDASMLQSGLAD